MAGNERLGHPVGMQDTSRWLSSAIPPDSRPSSPFEEPRQGFRTCRFPLALESCTPAGVPATGLGALFRWYRCAQPPANVPHPSGVKRKWPPWSVSHSSLHAQNPRPRRSGARDDGGLPGRCEEAAPPPRESPVGTSSVRPRPLPAFPEKWTAAAGCPYNTRRLVRCPSAGCNLFGPGAVKRFRNRLLRRKTRKARDAQRRARHGHGIADAPVPVGMVPARGARSGPLNISRPRPRHRSEIP